MDYTKKNRDGKIQISKDAALCYFLKGVLPSPDKKINALISELDKEIKSENLDVTREALSNAHGDWYEWLLSIAAWNYCVKNKKANLAILTPNISQFDISKLYTSELYNLITDLRDKVLISSSVQLISSNPDFVIVDRILVDKIIPNMEKIEVLNQEKIKEIASLYKKFEFKCSFESIIGYMSVKTSFRPDRRLQISHEGSLMKAIYTHLQTREWIINPKGLKYFALATKVGTQDRRGLKTVATHSITTVHSVPQAAVDEVYEVNSLLEAEEAFDHILHSHDLIVE